MIPRRRIPLSLPHPLRWLVSPCQGGESVGEFERAFAGYLGCRYARATASGRHALTLILDGLGLQAGDEVIIPAYTLGELLAPMQARGLVLRPADIEPDSFNMDPAAVAAQLTDRTRAILVVHLLGAPCAIEAIAALAEARQIPLIEDCAHALGASVAGRKLGSFGTAALFSLEVNKPVATFGGGMVVTGDERLAGYIDTELDRLPLRSGPLLRKLVKTTLEEWLVRSPLYAIAARLLFSERIAARFEAAYRGGNQQAHRQLVAYHPLQAALGIERLRQLDGRNQRLNRRWTELAAALPVGFTAQVRDKVGSPACYNFVALVAGDARALRQRGLRLGLDLGIGSEVMDDTAQLLNLDSCPNAAAVAGQAVLLPLYEGLSPRRLRRLVAGLHRLAGRPHG